MIESKSQYMNSAKSSVRFWRSVWERWAFGGAFGGASQGMSVISD